MSKFNTEKNSRLVELYQDHRKKLKCIGNTSHQNKRRTSGWELIAKAINNENRTHFTWEQCKKRWQNIKSTAKAQNAANKRSLKKTGGGPFDAFPLSDTSTKVIEFLGETTGFEGCEDGLETPVLWAEAECSSLAGFDADSPSPYFNSASAELLADSGSPLTDTKASASSSRSLRGKDCKKQKDSDDDLQMEIKINVMIK